VHSGTFILKALEVKAVVFSDEACTQYKGAMLVLLFRLELVLNGVVLCCSGVITNYDQFLSSGALCADAEYFPFLRTSTVT
jgi:hypothetical protein